MWKASASCDSTGRPIACSRCLRPNVPLVQGAWVCCIPSSVGGDCDADGFLDDVWLSATAVPTPAATTTIRATMPHR
jgi:hypothetical protein